MTTEKMDLRISGSSKMPGGEFASVHISGSGKITGNVSCETFHCAGAGKVLGDLTCSSSAKASGAAKVEGNMETGELKVAGAFKIEQNCRILSKAQVAGKLDVGGDLFAEALELSGACDVDGSLSCTTVDVMGLLKVEGGVEAERFRSAGNCNIKGLLNAETVQLDDESINNIHAIGGGIVEIVHGVRRHIFPFGLHPQTCLRSELVEADTVLLRSAEVDTVRGAKVNIGPNCLIRQIEYSESVQIDPSSHVDTVIQLPQQKLQDPIAED